MLKLRKKGHTLKKKKKDLISVFFAMRMYLGMLDYHVVSELWIAIEFYTKNSS